MLSMLIDAVDEVGSSSLIITHDESVAGLMDRVFELKDETLHGALRLILIYSLRIVRREWRRFCFTTGVAHYHQRGVSFSITIDCFEYCAIG